MVSKYIQKNVALLRIIIILTFVMVYISSTLQATNVKNYLKLEVFPPFSSQWSIQQSFLDKVESEIDNGFFRKVKKVVIDAGHGGHDSGCLGKNSKEKDITLQLSLKVADLIQKKYKDVEVLLTRNTDVFIPLFSRIQYANEQNADLFISIHCNYIHNTKTKGSETFVMGLHRAEDNLAVAKRENSSILLESNYKENYEGFDPNSPEGHIMMSMYQNGYLDKSIEFAADVEGQFSATKVSKSRGVKQAGFAVLRRASMPAVLVEAGFLSNEEEESYLISDEGQNKVANSLLKAFDNFYINNSKLMDLAIVPDKTSTIISDNSKKLNKSITSDIKKMEVVYKVQIAAIKNGTADLDSAELAKIGKLSVKKQDEMSKYMVGDYKTREEALSAREKLKSIGYQGAFLVSVFE